MSRIADTFANLKRANRRGFIPFITAGDPDLETTRVLIVELARVGATVIELGIPFTDPMADGPVIQRASERALRHDFGISDVLQIVSEARQETEVPIILFSYFNPLLQWCQKPDREGGRTSLAGSDVINDALPIDHPTRAARVGTPAGRASDTNYKFSISTGSTGSANSNPNTLE